MINLGLMISCKSLDPPNIREKNLGDQGHWWIANRFQHDFLVSLATSTGNQPYHFGEPGGGPRWCFIAKLVRNPQRFLTRFDILKRLGTTLLMIISDRKRWSAGRRGNYSMISRLKMFQIILLTEEILHQLIRSLSHCLQGLFIPGGAGFLPLTVSAALFVKTVSQTCWWLGTVREGWLNSKSSSGLIKILFAWAAKTTTYSFQHVLKMVEKEQPFQEKRWFWFTTVERKIILKQVQRLITLIRM